MKELKRTNQRFSYINMINKKRLYILNIFKSNYCKIIFLISLILVSFLIPKKIFYGFYSILGVVFILLTALTLTCLIRNVKEKISSAKSNGASVIGILSILFGFGALQACTIGAPVCGATLGAGVIALIFPGVLFSFLEKYGIVIIIFSIIIQIISLYFMNCFKKTD